MAQTDGFWLVEAGSVEVWRTTAAGRTQQFLFPCAAGELILGAAAGEQQGSDHNETGLRLRPGPDASLLPLDPASVAKLVAADDPRVLAWLERLAGLLLDAFPPAIPESLIPEQPGELTAGQVVEPPAQGYGWLVCGTGKVSILNAVEVGPADPPLPLPPGIWLTAAGGGTATCSLRALRSLTLPARQQSSEVLLEGFCLFVRIALAVLHAQDLCEPERQRERLRRRAEDDSRQTSEALSELAGVLGVQPVVPVSDELLAALAPIGRSMGVTFQTPIEHHVSRGKDNPIDAVAEASRVRYRRVRLRADWWRRDAGPLLGFLGAGTNARPVTLLPAKGGYQLNDPKQEKTVPVTPALRAQLAEEAIVFYRPLPPGQPTLLGMVRWALTPFRYDVLRVLLLLLVVALLGLLMPIAMRWIVDELLPDASREALLQLCLALIGVGAGQALLLLAQGVVSVRTQTYVTVQTQAAVWDRLLRLGTGFFQKYAAGDVHQRAMLITEISHTVNGTIIRTLLSGVFALLNLALLLYYAAHLALIGVIQAVVVGAITVGISLGIRRLSLRMRVQGGRLLSFVVQLIQGIGRLRVAAAERRAFNQWAQRFAEQLRLLRGIRLLDDVNRLVTTFLPGVAMLLLLTLVGNEIMPGGTGSKLTIGQFVAFLTAYGMFVSGLTSVSQTFVDVVDVLARERLLRPLLQEPTEHHGQRVDPGPLRGQLTVEQVSFRYPNGSSFALRDVNLTARPGEFVAVVGPSGSGKSTLLRLLLGFEKPESGRVYYDGRNLEFLDLTAVRRQLGVVLQSSWILAGTIYENIAAGQPVPVDEVWKAAQAAALAADIEQMPMKLHTLVAAGGVNLSGGQRQRLLLARALAYNPRLLLLDEATSSLDNPTQAHVSNSFRQRQITRIVVAHRLSTIVHSDRIYVLDQGRVVQVGTFAELAAQEGMFRTLIQRQQLEGKIQKSNHGLHG